jgi:hypothetical protein
MEYFEDKKEILLDKELNDLDNFVLDFVGLLDRYVIVSGYVSILFGRSRMTEDVDLLIPPMEEKEFNKLWEKLYDGGFWCINTPKPKDAFEMLGEHAIRFSRENAPIPNIEFKVIKNELDKFSYDHRIKVSINSKNLFISPLELQIAYKLFLGSEKDLEDARHLHNIFKDKLNKQELDDSIIKLNVVERMKFLKNGKHKRY